MRQFIEDVGILYGEMGLPRMAGENLWLVVGVRAATSIRRAIGQRGKGQQGVHQLHDTVAHSDGHGRAYGPSRKT